MDQEKMRKQLMSIAMFFILQPVLMTMNSLNLNDPLTLGVMVAMTVLWIGIGFGLYKKKEWARKGGVVIMVIQGCLALFYVAIMPSLLQQMYKGSVDTTFILITEGSLLLFVVAYFFFAWRLTRKPMKEYFASSVAPTVVPAK